MPKTETQKSRTVADCDDEESINKSCISENGTTTKDIGGESSTSQEEMAKKETMAVLRLRVLVILVLLAVAGAVTGVVYWVTSSGESNQFRAQYNSAVEKLEASFTEILHKMTSISMIGVSYTSYSVDNNLTFPFVTLPSFHEKTLNTMHASGAHLISFAPFVSLDQFEEWDAFVSSEENQWL